MLTGDIECKVAVNDQGQLFTLFIANRIEGLDVTGLFADLVGKVSGGDFADIDNLAAILCDHVMGFMHLPYLRFSFVLHRLSGI